jgi:peroxiredoxin
MSALVKTTLIAISLVSSLSGCAANSSNTLPKKGYETYIQLGEAFKHTKFNDIEGKQVVLGNKKKLIIFFATWCSDSQRTFKELKASSIINDKNIQIIGIGREESDESIKQFNQTYELEFPLISDPQRAIYQHYANKGVPRLILLDEKNMVVKTLIGEQPNIIDKINW